MKIAIVHNTYGRISGEEIVIANLIALLKKRGVAVSRFSRSSAEIENKRLGKISAFFSGIHNPFAKKEFEKFLNEERPDIVHVHNLYPLISPAILSVCKKLGIPVVMTVHNFRLACPNGLLMCRGEICHRCLGGREYWCILRNCEEDIFKSMGYTLRTVTARVMRSYYDHVDHFICLTRFQRDILIKEGLPQDKISVMTNPVVIKVTEQSIAEKKDTVLFVGRVSKEKGIASLFAAARTCSDISFVVAGSYAAMPEACDMVGDNIVLLGALQPQALGRLYKKARIFVLPSVWYEGFPTVLLEAMSYGLPVICSRIGGLSEIVEDNMTGLLYEPGNAGELAECIRKLWQDPDLCKNLGDAGRKKLGEKYDAEKIMDRLLEMYEKVLKEKAVQS